jgi:hypothetical protein
MHRRQNLNCRAKVAVVPDANRANVENDAIEIEIDSFAEFDVDPIIAKERRLHPHRVAAFSENQLAEFCPKLSLRFGGGIKLSTEFPDVGARSDQFGVENIVELSCQHLFSFGSHSGLVVKENGTCFSLTQRATYCFWVSLEVVSLPWNFSLGGALSQRMICKDRSMTRRTLLLGSALAFLCGTGIAVQAAEVVVNDDYYAPAWVYRHGEYRLAPRDRLTVQSEGPGIYAGSFRPANCGVFHYWDGSECIDARAAPPPQ